ncbi:AT-rich interactive domain-containing protein 3A [Crotalus adamanteus]|uniref:AT-rich interactive domain-containing protein 3 n=1 Tax=Crotalus adamanteus TaxID=8729 RepID=A0AAW1C484_CROAD
MAKGCGRPGRGGPRWRRAWRQWEDSEVLRPPRPRWGWVVESPAAAGGWQRGAAARAEVGQSKGVGGWRRGAGTWAEVGQGSGEPGSSGGSRRPTKRRHAAGGERAGQVLRGNLLTRKTAERRGRSGEATETLGDPPQLIEAAVEQGTPVNRIPIMAKQVLDLYMLYVLVTEKGGLVEVINKKLWREITKGLNLPTSITSAAFTLRTQYMKYLYPYECEKRGLSNPNELQAAIDSNRREGRRQGFSGSIFTYSPSGTHTMLSSPKLQVPTLGLTSTTNGSPIAPVPKIKKEEDSAIPIAVPTRLPVSLASHPVVAAQAAAVQAAAAQAAVAAQAAALEQLREKLESGEPPEKKMALVTDEQQRLMQRAIQQNLLAMTAQLPMSIRINSQGARSPENRQDSSMNLAANGTSSISMSVEINGIVYAGVLFAQTPGASSSHNKGSANSGRSSSSTGSGGGGGATGGTTAGSQVGVAPAPTSTSTNSLSP